MDFEKKYFKDISYRKLSNIDQPTFNSQLVSIVCNLDVHHSLSFKETITQITHKCQSLVDIHAPLISRKVSTVDSAPWFDKEYRHPPSVRWTQR